MKKLLLFGAALTFIFSACSPLDLLDPIPQPGKGQIYVQAKSAPNGDTLCGLAKAGAPFDYYETIGLADDSFVNGYLSSKYVLLPYGKDASVKVWIESTLPNITLKPTDVIHYFATDTIAWALNPVPVAIPPYFTVQQSGESFVMTANDGTDPIFTVTWQRKVYTAGAIDWTMPTFSQWIEIKRAGPDHYVDQVAGAIHVKAEGAEILGNDPCYTGFKLVLGNERNAIDLIASQLTQAYVSAMIDENYDGAAMEINTMPDETYITHDPTDSPIYGLTHAYNLDSHYPGMKLEWSLTLDADGNNLNDPSVTISAYPGQIVQWGASTMQLYLTATLTVGSKTITKNFVY